VADIVYQGIVGVLKAPDGDRFMVIGEHAPENFVFDPHFLGIERSPDLIIIQVTSTVGNTKEQKLAFFRQLADELNRRLDVRREDVFINRSSSTARTGHSAMANPGDQPPFQAVDQRG
jgi:hypothetical protein